MDIKNISDIWKELNKIMDLYLDEDMSYNTAVKKISELNENNFGIEINHHAVLDREEMNEEGLISYEEEDSYDEDEYD